VRQASGILLAIDTSTRMVSLALYDGVQVLSESSWTSTDYHTVELAPAVAEAFGKANLTANDLDVFGSSTRTRSFTGLRIGMALAKGLAAGAAPADDRSPDFGYPGGSTAHWAHSACGCLTRRARSTGSGLVPASKRELGNDPKIELCTPEELAERITQPTLICGELNEAEREFLGHNKPEIKLAFPAQSLRRAGFLAEIAWKRWKAGQSDDPASLSPIYCIIMT